MPADAAYEQAAERLIDFLAAEYDDSGTPRSAPDNVQFYYKLPAVLHYGGHRKLAQRTLEQALARFVYGGQFRLDSDPIAGPWRAYLVGWLAWGAGALGRFDVARTFVDSVLPLSGRRYRRFPAQHAGGSDLGHRTQFRCVNGLCLGDGLGGR